jgi:uncharacterized membrane protein (GlpM family)
MDILIKGIIGGLITALIAWLSTKGNVLPGILPLFPTFGLIALYLVGLKGDPVGFQETCLAAFKTIPAYLVFLGVCYVAVKKVHFRTALALGLAGWFLVALATFVSPLVRRGR